MKVVYSVTVEDDRRYRTLVLLNRSDRPVHSKFHCVSCTMPVAELVNQEVQALSDTVDMRQGLVGVRCDGRTGHGRCARWYFFSLNESNGGE